MAITRHTTGSSRPRVFPVVETAPATTRKRATKPKSKKTATGRVTKPGAATKKTKATTKTGTAAKPRKVGVVDKVKGALKKVEGAVTGKPGKKAAGTAKMRGTDGKKKTTVKKAA